MLKLFVPSPVPNIRIVPFLAQTEEKDSRLFQYLPPTAYTGAYTRVNQVHEADLIAIPHEYDELKRHPDALFRYLSLGGQAHKKILISAYQDSTTPISLPNSIVLRPSAYAHSKLSHEIIMPAYVEDLGSRYGAEPLSVSLASVGFVGKAGFDGIRSRLRYVIKDQIFAHGPRRGGMYFRRHALHSLSRDPRITLRATFRRRYSGNTKSIEIDPQQARSEFVDSIQKSLFTLAPRGDGNYSLRFYETLALGRIPILIDTDLSLPLEDRIAYDTFVVRVPWQKVNHTSEYVRTFFARYTLEELVKLQRTAREVFEKYLYMPAFFRTVLTKEFMSSFLALS